MPPVQEDHRHHMSYVPALEGENNLDEWKRNVIRALTSRGLIHVLEGVQHDQESSQDEVECSSSSAPEVSVEICTSHTNSNVDAASDMSARQEKQRSMERSEAVLLMSQSLVGVHEWLVLHGFDASEENPARYFQAVQDVFTQLSTWTEDSTKEELMKIQPDPFKPIEAYQQRLSFLRNRYLRAGGFWSRDDREREVLWWAIEGIKAWSTTLHARLTRDMMEAPGSGQRLTWPRLMQQLAFIHECDRYDYILGPEATDGQSRIMIKKCYR